MELAHMLTQFLTNASQQKTGNHSKQQNQVEPPTGVLRTDLGENQSCETRYWENPVKDSGEIRVGYIKSRIVSDSKGETAYKSFHIRQALGEIESTLRLCERALNRHLSGEIVLFDADRLVAEQVVQTFGSHFATGTPQAAIPAELQTQLSRLLTGISGSNGATT